MEKIKKLYFKYQEMIAYLFFGGLTTVCNFVVYFIATRLFTQNELVAAIEAFVISVIFAFWTNRKWVFKSSAKGIKAVSAELAKFFSGRLFSGGMDLLIIFIFVTRMGMNDLIIKIISNILVIILNYFISKLLVFKKEKK